MSKYWEKRAVERMYEAMELAETAADELAKIYIKSSRYICSESDNVFEKFRQKYNLTKEQARRIVSKWHSKNNIEVLTRLILSESGVSEKVLMAVESVAYRARLE